MPQYYFLLAWETFGTRWPNHRCTKPIIKTIKFWRSYILFSPLKHHSWLLLTTTSNSTILFSLSSILLISAHVHKRISFLALWCKFFSLIIQNYIDNSKHMCAGNKLTTITTTQCACDLTLLGDRSTTTHDLESWISV